MPRVIEYFAKSLKIIQCHSKWYYSKSWVRFPIRIPFRDKARHWPKIAIYYTSVHSTSPLGGFRPNIAFGMKKKLDWCGCPMVKKFHDIFKCFDIILACDRQTHRQTDGQTYCHGIVRAMHKRRAVKICTTV